MFCWIAYTHNIILTTLNFLDLGLHTIYEWPNTEKNLISALKTEAQLIKTQGGNNHYISILAEILD